MQAGNLTQSPKDAAEVLDNFFPTTQSVRIRKGCSEYADLGASVKRLMVYSSGSFDDLYGSTANSVFDVDRVNGGSNTFAELEGLSSGDWVTTQISTSAGEYMIAVNGADYAFYYDGANIEPLVGESTFNLGFDAETAAFAVGQTVTGGTSSATATIYGITKTSATAGTLKIGAITGTFQDNETITDAATGSATSDIPSGTSAASTISITGKATKTFSQTWIWKERLFFVEGGTQSIWYLPAKTIGGAATEINLGSVFRRGGDVLFGANWSLDSGQGIDDVCIIVTSNGEVAVYEGTDPASASTFALVGVYDIGLPLNKHASFKAGGDLAVLTEGGIVAVSEALRKDRAALRGSAITAPIEDAWLDAVANDTSSFPITATLWQSQSMLVVGVPVTDGGTNVAYISNAATGAWARYTGWDIRCSSVSNDKFYFGSDDGKVYQGETGGDDAGVQYAGLCVPKFSEAGPQRKYSTRAQVISRAPVKPALKVVGLADYKVPEISAPTATGVPDVAVWGTGVWGTFVWGTGSEKFTFSTWKKVNGTGFSLAPAVLVTSNNTIASDVEILSFKMRYEIGSIL